MERERMNTKAVFHHSIVAELSESCQSSPSLIITSI
jgi:hypothetical protein